MLSTDCVSQQLSFEARSGFDGVNCAEKRLKPARATTINPDLRIKGHQAASHNNSQLTVLAFALLSISHVVSMQPGLRRH